MRAHSMGLHPMRLILPLFILGAITPCKISGSQTLTCNPDKRLKALISSDSMNRLAVANDRITQIFGDSETYEVQTEESTGQVFLKPTAENGTKPLSVTLITENGLTQDMTLEPATRDATTVILKNPASPPSALPSGVFQGRYQGGYQGNHQAHLGFQGIGQPNFGYQNLSFQEQVIVAMKEMVSGQAPEVGVEFCRKDPKNLAVGLIAAYAIGPFRGFKLDVKNISGAPLDILEKDFCQIGDLAISFEKRVLAKGESTICYVVTSL